MAEKPRILSGPKFKETFELERPEAAIRWVEGTFYTYMRLIYALYGEMPDDEFFRISKGEMNAMGELLRQNSQNMEYRISPKKKSKHPQPHGVSIGFYPSSASFGANKPGLRFDLSIWGSDFFSRRSRSFESPISLRYERRVVQAGETHLVHDAKLVLDPKTEQAALVRGQHRGKVYYEDLTVGNDSSVFVPHVGTNRLGDSVGNVYTQLHYWKDWLHQYMDEMRET